MVLTATKEPKTIFWKTHCSAIVTFLLRFMAICNVGEKRFSSTYKNTTVARKGHCVSWLVFPNFEFKKKRFCVCKLGTLSLESRTFKFRNSKFRICNLKIFPLQTGTLELETRNFELRKISRFETQNFEFRNSKVRVCASSKFVVSKHKFSNLRKQNFDFENLMTKRNVPYGPP